MVEGSISKETMDLNQLIRIKEWELREIQDSKCKQLEECIVEKEKLIHDYINMMDILKTDFQFNLKLLEARDKEIQKYELELQQSSEQLQLLESERQMLIEKVEELSEKEISHIHSQEHDKSHNKTKLLELKQEIEHTYWTFTEERRTLQTLNESLRQELSQIVITRDDQLTKQRHDLTYTFDELIQQKDDHYLIKEKQYQQQIHQYELKIEELKNQNTCLHCEIISHHRIAIQFENNLQDRLVLIKELKKEKEKLLLFHQESEQTANQKYEKMRVEMEEWKDRCQDIQMKMEHALVEKEKALENERMNRQSAEHTALVTAEQSTSQLLQWRTQTDELMSQERYRMNEVLSKYNQLQLQYQEKESMHTIALTSIETENIQLMRRIRILEQDVSCRQNQLSLLSVSLQTAQDQIKVREQQSHTSLLPSLSPEQQKEQQQSQPQPQSQPQQEGGGGGEEEGLLNGLKKEKEKDDDDKEEKEEVQQSWEGMAQRKEYQQQQQQQQQYAVLVNEIQSLKDIIASSSSSSSHHQQSPQQHQPQHQQQGVGVQEKASSRLFDLSIRTTETQPSSSSSSSRLAPSRQPLVPLASPAFSEDQGPVSVPASPTLSHSQRSPQWRRVGGRGSGGSGSSSRSYYNSKQQSPFQFPTPQHMSGEEWKRVQTDDDDNDDQISNYNHNDDYDDNQDNNNFHDDHDNDRINQLMNENQQLEEQNVRLKTIIKDMRVEMESYSTTTQLSHQSEHQLLTDKNLLLQKEVDKLTERLTMSTNEIVRLRTERRRLMELGNELRGNIRNHPTMNSSSSSSGGGVVTNTMNIPTAMTSPTTTTTISSSGENHVDVGFPINMCTHTPYQQQLSQQPQQQYYTYTSTPLPLPPEQASNRISYGSSNNSNNNSIYTLQQRLPLPGPIPVPPLPLLPSSSSSSSSQIPSSISYHPQQPYQLSQQQQYMNNTTSTTTTTPYGGDGISNDIAAANNNTNTNAMNTTASNSSNVHSINHTESVTTNNTNSITNPSSSSSINYPGRSPTRLTVTRNTTNKSSKSIATTTAPSNISKLSTTPPIHPHSSHSGGVSVVGVHSAHRKVMNYAINKENE